MKSRTDMDRPATVLVAVVGVALIATSLPFLIADGGGSQRYDLAWQQVEDGSADAPFAGNGQTATVTLTASGLLSNITVTMPSCLDQRNPVDPPASITWTLFRDGASYDQGTASCPNVGDVKTIALHGHPDKGSVTASSQSDAEDEAYSEPAYPNATHEFRLEFQWSRTSSVPPGLPVGGSTFSGRMGLRADEWRVTANAQGEEVGR